VPEQSRVERRLHLHERAKKNGNAQKPRAAANRRGEPRQMDEPRARPRERLRIDYRSTTKVAKSRSEVANPFHPKPDPDRKDQCIVNDDCRKEALLQGGRREHRLNDGRVVPNVKGAPENLRYDWRERGEQQSVTFARQSHFLVSVHGRK